MIIPSVDLGRRPDDLVNLIWRRDLRIWRELIATNEAKLAGVLASPATAGLAREFAGRRTENGRRKVVHALCGAFGELAEFRVARLRGAAPRAMWAMIRLDSDGAHVGYLGIGNRLIVTGVWNLKVRTHSLERFFQRQSGGANLSAALYEAHANVCVGRFDRQLPLGEEAIVSAGMGALRATIAPAPAGSLTGGSIATAWTWVPAAALTDRHRARLAQPPDNEGGRYPSTPPVFREPHCSGF